MEAGAHAVRARSAGAVYSADCSRQVTGEGAGLAAVFTFAQESPRGFVEIQSPVMQSVLVHLLASPDRSVTASVFEANPYMGMLSRDTPPTPIIDASLGVTGR